MSSSHDSAPTVDLSPDPGYGALRVLLLVHVIPLAAIPLLLHLSGWLPLLLAVGIGGSWLYVRRRPALGFGPRALTRLTLHGDGSWNVEDEAGRHKAELQRSSVVWGRTVILNFRLANGARRSRILYGDEVNTDALRRLRARLLNESPQTSDKTV